MQDLQGDATVCGMHRVGDDTVPLRLPGKRQLRGPGLEPSGEVGSDAAGNDQADAAARPRLVKRGESRKAVWRFLQSRMHRTHEDAVAQRREAEVEWSEELRIGRHRDPQGLQAGKLTRSAPPQTREWRLRATRFELDLDDATQLGRLSHPLRPWGVAHPERRVL